MSTGKHTPGPWTANQTRLDPASRADRVTVFSRTGIVAQAVRGSDSIEIDTLNANAALIAAAPDLREALESTIKALAVAVARHEQAIAMARADGAFVPEEFGERGADVFRIAIRDARAALAKASGK